MTHPPSSRLSRAKLPPETRMTVAIMPARYAHVLWSCKWDCVFKSGVERAVAREWERSGLSSADDRPLILSMPIRGSHKSWALWTACVSSPWNELILNATKSLFNSASTSLSLSLLLLALSLSLVLQLYFFSLPPPVLDGNWKEGEKSLAKPSLSS